MASMMNWGLLTLIIVGIASCVGVSIEVKPKEQSAAELKISTDAETGCQYLHHGSSITPRLDRSGRQVCFGAKDAAK